MNRLHLVLLATAGVLLAACAPSAQQAPLAAQTSAIPLVRTELYFGRIPLAAWNQFLAQSVTPRFPDGLTWFDTHGQWQNRSGALTRQDSRVLILIHAPGAEKNRLIDQVREEFKARQHEQSVLRADQPVSASF